MTDRPTSKWNEWMNEWHLIVYKIYIFFSIFRFLNLKKGWCFRKLADRRRHKVKSNNDPNNEKPRENFPVFFLLNWQKNEFSCKLFFTQCPKHQHIADGVVQQQQQQENHEKLNFKLKKIVSTTTTTTKEAAEKKKFK